MERPHPSGADIMVCLSGKVSSLFHDVEIKILFILYALERLFVVLIDIHVKYYVTTHTHDMKSV